METNFDHLTKQKIVANNQNLTAENLIKLIQFLNTDSACV